MRHYVTAGAMISLVGCGLSQPRFVSIDPEHGYVDGCTEVMLQGAGLGTDATATLDGAPFTAWAPAEADPNRPAWAQDVGFKYTGRTPPKADGVKGFADVMMSVGDWVLGLRQGFYYETCPGPYTITDLTTPDSIVPGSQILLHGCGLVATGATVNLLDSAGAIVGTAPLEAECSTGIARFTVPDLAPASYYLQIADADGGLWYEACLTDTTDAGTDASDADSAALDTGDPCADSVFIVVDEPASPPPVDASAGGAP